MKIAIGSDHAGFELKEALKTWLAASPHQVEDAGTHSEASVDYPDYAEKVARAVAGGRADRGILICGTGVGICIAANKVRGIRAAPAWNPDIARLSRQHNDANVLCLSGRFIEAAAAREIVQAWLDTPFEGGRHQRRVDKISQLEHP
jgi:ribose 5-phosphate isomerase B